MVRRHGWQLPAHSFQVVAITVFFLLAVAFFIFLAPFLWLGGLESAAFAVYSPLFFAVLLLYIRCSAINPADPGVLGNQPLSKHDENSSYSQISGAMTPAMSSPLSALQSEKDYNRRSSLAEQGRIGWNNPPALCSFTSLCGLCCGWLVSDDKCFKEAKFEQPVPEEDILFCTLCNAEVRKYSKHCRSCDKCVDGFDHHCRWLNNCVGRKNYSTFVALMATSLLLLVVEWGIGAAVFIRCFVDRTGTEDQIVTKLGNGFSTAPFAAVVLLCTIVAFLASIPLGELFFFHLILMKKGITTYEYVVAVRAQNEGPIFGEEEESVLSSPGGSTTTGVSGSSSLGLQHRGSGGWCTPPRIFIEHQVCYKLGTRKLHGNMPAMGTIVEEKVIEEKSTEEKVSEENIVGEKRSMENSTEEHNSEEQSTENQSCREEFVNQLEPSRVPSTIDPDAVGRPKKRAPASVRISAWKLSKLNAQEASQAAAKARENSSVLQKLGLRDLGNVPETDYTSSSNVSSQSALSMEYTLKRALQKGPEKVLSPRGPPSLNPELFRTRAAKLPAFSSLLPLESADGDSEGRSSVSSHSISSTLPDSLSLSPLPAERRYGLERPYPGGALGVRGAPGEPMPSASSAVITSLAARSSSPTFQRIAVLNPATTVVGRNYNSPGGVSVVSRNGHGASSAANADDLAPPPRGRSTPLKDHKRSAVFWSRPGLGRYGGDPSGVGSRPHPRIEFGGSGISTSTFPSQVPRRATWAMNPLSQSDASGDLASSELGPGSESASVSPATTAPHATPTWPSQSSNSQGGFSIFYGPPTVPLGERTGNRRETSHPPPPRPPMDPQAAGVQRPPGPESRPPSRGSNFPRSQSPTLIPRNLH